MNEKTNVLENEGRRIPLEGAGNRIPENENMDKTLKNILKKASQKANQEPYYKIRTPYRTYLAHHIFFNEGGENVVFLWDEPYDIPFTKITSIIAHREIRKGKNWCGFGDEWTRTSPDTTMGKGLLDNLDITTLLGYLDVTDKNNRQVDVKTQDGDVYSGALLNYNKEQMRMHIKMYVRISVSDITFVAIVFRNRDKKIWEKPKNEIK